MDGGRYVKAQFVEAFRLGVRGLSPEGTLLLELEAGEGEVYIVESSLDLQLWESAVVVTNEVGLTIPVEVGSEASRYYRARLR